MRHNYHVRLEKLTTEPSTLIRDFKTDYHGKLAPKLFSPCTNAKT